MVLVGVIPAANLVAVAMYDLDTPPLACLAHHILHDGGKGALAKLMRHVITVCVDAHQL